MRMIGCVASRRLFLSPRMTFLLSVAVVLFGAFIDRSLASPQSNRESTRSAPPAPERTEPEAHPDILLVGYRRGVTRANRAATHAAASTQLVRSFDRIPVDVVRISQGQRRDQVMATYRRQRDVAYVEPNYRLHKNLIPNDPDFGELWGLHNTGQTGGTPGADIRITNVWASGITGSSDIIVAVIDTGIDYNHEDLADNMWTNPAPNFGDIYGARWTTGDGTVTSGDPMDGDGHGTHVAGTIGAVGDNGIGIAGVNWSVRLMALKFLDDDDGSGWTVDAISALEYAIEKGAHLSNNSWGGGGFSQALKDMIEAAGTANQLFVASAGNSASDNDSWPSYPASYDLDNIISVASSDRNDARSGFSNYGRESVHLAAPGSAIYSSVPDDDYDTYNGTSMAAPHVAGVAALLLSLEPTASYQDVKNWILDGTRRLPAWSGLTVTAGRLDAESSVRLMQLPSWVEPVGDFVATSGEGQTSVSLAWANPVDGRFDRVIIRRDVDGSLIDWTDGDAVYEGSDESDEDGPFETGDRLSYAVWAVYVDGVETYYSAPRFARTRVGGYPDDYFTEWFTNNDNDLAYKTVTFVPSGEINGYNAYTDSAEQFPTDPSGGTVLPLGDDEYEVVDLQDGKTVILYGVEYDTLHVGTHGYITFGQGDTTFDPSLGGHFSLPRVSIFFNDFLDDDGLGTISWKQLSDRVVVTYEDVPEFFTSNSNNFQAELFFDGRIRLTWLGMDARNGLVGLSEGFGIPDNFEPSDLSEYPSIDDLRIMPTTGLHASGFIGGPFTPDQVVYGVTNVGAAALTWTVAASPDWIQVTPDGGTLDPDEAITITVSLAEGVESDAHGFREGFVVFSNQVSGMTQRRPVSLSILREGMTSLYYADRFVGEDHVSPAVRRAGYEVTVAESWTDFNGLLESNTYSIAVMLNQAESIGADRAVLEDHIESGGRVILTDWSRSSAFADLLEASYTGNRNETPVDITHPDLADGVTNPMPLVNPGWGTWAFGLTPRYDGKSLGTFPSEESAIVWGHNGRTALLGFTADTLSGTDGPVFFDNLLALVETGGDPISVAPRAGWSSSGFELGPFTPDSQVYTIHNTGTEPLDWGAAVSADWLAVDATSGSLAADASTDVTVSVTAAADLLHPGFYEDHLVISNRVTGRSLERSVSLRVMPLPGEIHVFDSVAPTNDLHIPFGHLIVGQERVEQITIYNADPTYDLIIEGVAVLAALPDPENGELALVATNPETTRNEPVVPGRDRVLDPDKHPWVPDSLLVGFHNMKDLQKRDDVHAAVGAQRVHRYSRIAVDVVSLPADSDMKTLIEIYESQPGVAYAEPNYIQRAVQVPNDPRFDDLWALQNTGQTGGTPGADISALPAWSITRGSPDVVVAIIDTGIDYNHPDLAANMWVNPSPTFGDIHGARWTNGDGSVTSGDPMDGDGHGTHCAGTVGAVGNNGVGVVGVNWNVSLMGLKFLTDEGWGATADAISAVEYAIENGAHLSNNSWGGGGFSQALKDIIDAAGAAGQLFIAAAGNDGDDTDLTPHYPSSYTSENIISVASSDHNDERSNPGWWASNYGAESVHLAAPGSDILSTVPNSAYDTYSGTSMATPHVAGVAALMLALNPNATPGQLKQALLDSVDVLPAWEGLTVTGGRLNAAAALQALNPHFSIIGAPPLPFIIGTGESVTFDVIYRPVESGEHEGYVRIASNDTNAPVVDVVISGSAEDDALDISPETPFISSGEPGGPFTPDNAVYTLTNSGMATLDWNATLDVNWLDLSAASGELAAGEDADLTLTLNAEAETLDSGTYNGQLIVSNLTTGVRSVRAIRLTVIPSLCAAVDACELVWITGGHGDWFAQTEETYDGVDAAQSGPITHNQESWIETAVEGPGDLSFWWKVSSESGWDFLEFYINGELQDDISGEVDWRQEIYAIGAGPHTLRWRYEKDGSVNRGSDCGWLDQVSYVQSELTIVPVTGFSTSGPLGGPFDPLSQVFVISNVTAGTVDWSLGSDVDWVDFSSISGSLAGYEVADVTVSVNAQANLLDYGSHPGSLILSNVISGAVLSRPLVLTVLPPLCEAVDACELVWTTGGHGDWFAQTEETYDGVDAAQSGDITHNQESWIETEVEGPGDLSFWWKVSSESNYDFLEFYIDGDRQDRISGEVDWRQETYAIGEGPHTLRWRYMKDGSVDRGSDCGWLDRVVYIADSNEFDIEGMTMEMGSDSLKASVHLGVGQEGSTYYLEYTTNLIGNPEVVWTETASEEGDGVTEIVLEDDDEENEDRSRIYRVLIRQGEEAP